MAIRASSELVSITKVFMVGKYNPFGRPLHVLCEDAILACFLGQTLLSNIINEVAA